MTPTASTTAHAIAVNQTSYTFGAIGSGEERFFSFFVKPVTGSPVIRSVEILSQQGIAVLSPTQANARAAVACEGLIDRFCVVVVRIDTSSLGTKALSFELRYSDVMSPGVIRTFGPLSATGTVVSTRQVEKNRFRTVSLSAKAIAAGQSSLQYLQDQMARNSPTTFRSDDALLFDQYDDPNGNPGNPVVWKRNWSNSVFDFTGSCFDSYRFGNPLPTGQAAPDSTGCVAITRCHILSAFHYPRNANGASLYGKDGNGGWMPMAAAANTDQWECRKLPSFDSLVCRMDPCLPESIKVYPLLAPNEPVFTTPSGTSPIQGAPYINNHYSLSLGIRRISLASINSITQDFVSGMLNTSPLVAPYPFMQTPAVVGDSGSPSFLFFDGETVVMSTFTYGGYGGGGPSFSSSQFQQELQQAINQIPAP